MKLNNTLLLLLLVLFGTGSYAQDFKERDVKTAIREVTVFLRGAQIYETGSVMLTPGKTILHMKGLSPYLDEKSIQVKAEGNFTILCVNHKFNFLDELKRDVKVDSLQARIETIESQVARENARLEVLQEKQSVLNANKSLENPSGITMTQLKQAMEFYDAEISKIKDEGIRIKKNITRYQQERDAIEKQLREVNETKSTPTSEVEVRVSASAAANASFNLTYVVSNAGWYPKYDIRVQNIKSPLELTYKAEVFQNTGVDWKNVKLKFSNGDPNQSGVAPELATWNLTYARYAAFFNKSNPFASQSVRNVSGRIMDETGNPVSGVNVLVKGTTVGTATDVNGRYSLTLPNDASTLVFSFIGYSTQELPISQSEMNVRLAPDVAQLAETVTVGYGGLEGKVAGVRIRGNNSISKEKAGFTTPLPTIVVENQTTVEIAVDVPYTIKSNGEKLMVDLKKYNIDAAYEYYAVPKLDKDAFLIARVINWDQYNLLEGEANLYFEDAYVGRSVLDAKALTDTLTISLGRDKNIVIGRTKVDQFSKRRAIGVNQIESRGFKFQIRNKKSEPVKLTVFDQLPVSIASDITVNPLELSNATLEEQTGKLSWEITIEPQEQKEWMFEYEVKYPRRERVVVE